jgi:hypothetical protein
MMPQNNVLPDWRATYPNDAPAQKPGGVTVATTATAPRVPNKPTYSAGTIQSYDPELGQMVLDKLIDKVQDRVDEAAPESVAEEAPHTQEEVEEAEMEEAEENGEDDEDGKPRRTTTRTTRTTTRRR